MIVRKSPSSAIDSKFSGRKRTEPLSVGSKTSSTSPSNRIVTSLSRVTEAFATGAVYAANPFVQCCGWPGRTLGGGPIMAGEPPIRQGARGLVGRGVDRVVDTALQSETV